MEEVKRVLKGKLERFEIEEHVLKERDWLSDYNGRMGVETHVLGIDITEIIRPVLDPMIQVAFSKNHRLYMAVLGVRKGEEAERVTVWLEIEEPVYNQYNRWVGSNREVLSLEELLKLFKEEKEYRKQILQHIVKYLMGE